MYDYLPNFIKQFDPEEGELIIEDWSAVQFLKWLELNKFKIVKDESSDCNINNNKII